jgi:nucleotide-binding universal stress UspA family protein
MLSPSLSSILVATDLSDASRVALRAAGTLAVRTRAELHVVYAFEFPPAPYSAAYWGDGTGIPDVHEFNRTIQSLESQLDAMIGETVPQGTRCTRRIGLGSPTRVVLNRAGEVGAELLVLGPHRRRLVGDTLRSGTAEQLLHASQTPCLVVPADFALPLRRVVVPFDLTHPGRAAVDAALRWGAAFGAADPVTCLPDLEMKVVHVISTHLMQPSLPFDHATVGPALHADVERAVAGAAGACGVEVTEEIVFGENVAETIAAYARRNEAGLLVMGTHAYGAVRRALIGSVASGVARRAPCAVLLIPPSAAPVHVEERAEVAAAV